MEDFGFTKDDHVSDKRAYYAFVGGEDRGLKRMNEFIFESKSLGNFVVWRDAPDNP